MKSVRGKRVVTSVKGLNPPLVRQEFKADTDINSIMKRMLRTGVVPDAVRQNAAVYGDFSQVPDYATMHDKVMAARELFNHLPAGLRAEFRNDPGAFISGVSTPKGHEILAKHGLLRALPREMTKRPDVPADSVDPVKV